MRIFSTTLAILLVVISHTPSAQAVDAHYLVNFQRLKLTGTFYAEGAHFADFNKDGHSDIVSGPYIYLGPTFKSKLEIYPVKAYQPKAYSENFLTYTGDIDSDSYIDVIVMPWPGKTVKWYKNPGKSVTADPKKHWTEYKIIDGADNESPTFLDIDGDGRPDVVCHQAGYFGYATPGPDPTKPWTFNRISPKVAGGRYTHGLGVGDVNGDGKMDLLEKNGWWEQPKSNPAKTKWKFHKVSFGPGGAQMYAYDVDGDGDNDIITSIHAHAYGLAWFENKTDASGNITFTHRVIIDRKPSDNPYGVCFTQMHGIDLVDINGDGLKDIITGKRYFAHGGRDPEGKKPAVLYWFQLTRPAKGKAEFVPRKVDDDSGVGTQITAGDISGNNMPDILVGNKKGTYIFFQSRVKVSKKAYDAAQPKKVKPKTGE